VRQWRPHPWRLLHPDTFKSLGEWFDFILDTVSAPHDYNAYLGLLKVDGTMILVGAPSAPSTAWPPTSMCATAS
jgi:D-arabinose 1-dehydrogenase-like Zn-dependent alcohol dehydrogenase